MAVYVDELANWPTSIRCFKSGSCHMIADSVEELKTAATQIGLKLEWLQPAKRGWREHFDVTPSKRAAAIINGAVVLTRRAFRDKMVVPGGPRL